MVNILNTINTAAKNMLSFDSHAAKQLSLEEKLLYLQGLALVMNADQEIHEKEKEYLKVLIRSFEIDESVIDTLEEFSLNPDQDTIQCILKAFMKRDMSITLLFDMFMIANSDGDISDREISVIKSLCLHFKLDINQFSKINMFFCSMSIKPNFDDLLLLQDIPIVNYLHLFEFFNIEKSEIIMMLVFKLNVIFHRT
ncbi:TerB family tellurite resistance protein [Vibrio sp. 2092]|nr:TerB family tellurite resistance protein [Vibrio sp. 2092]